MFIVGLIVGLAIGVILTFAVSVVLNALESSNGYPFLRG